MEGLWRKFDDPDFVTYLEQFSFITLCETFAESVSFSGSLQDFECHVAPAKKLSNHGRLSGGVLCLIKKCFGSFFQRITCSYDNIIVFKVCITLFGVDQDILLFCVYIPPAGSPFYQTAEERNAF